MHSQETTRAETRLGSTATARDIPLGVPITKFKLDIHGRPANLHLRVSPVV
jgi:hypothetical protein